MKSLRDEIRLAAGDMDGFNFIQADGLDFICISRFHPCESKDFIKTQLCGCWQPAFTEPFGL